MHMRMGLLLTSFVTLPPSALAAWVPLRPLTYQRTKQPPYQSHAAQQLLTVRQGWRANTDNNLLTNSRGGN